MGAANVRLLAKGLASRALWPVGLMFFGGIALAEAVFAAPQAFVDQVFRLLHDWGVAGAFTAGRWGLDIRVAADPELRRLMLASMAVAGLLLVLLVHQAVLFFTRPHRGLVVSRDRSTIRWLAPLMLLFVLLGAGFFLLHPLDAPIRRHVGRHFILQPGIGGESVLFYKLLGFTAWVGAVRAWLWASGRLKKVPPSEHWPTQPWMSRFPMREEQS
jgi:hypothetical protein